MCQRTSLGVNALLHWDAITNYAVPNSICPYLTRKQVVHRFRAKSNDWFMSTNGLQSLSVFSVDYAADSCEIFWEQWFLVLGLYLVVGGRCFNANQGAVVFRLCQSFLALFWFSAVWLVLYVSMVPSLYVVFNSEVLPPSSFHGCIRLGKHPVFMGAWLVNAWSGGRCMDPSFKEYSSRSPSSLPHAARSPLSTVTSTSDR